MSVCVQVGAVCLCLWGLSLTSELTDFGSLLWGLPVFALAVSGLQEGCHTHSAFLGIRTPVLTLQGKCFLDKPPAQPQKWIFMCTFFPKERGHNFSQITKGSWS